MTSFNWFGGWFFCACIQFPNYINLEFGNRFSPWRDGTCHRKPISFMHFQLQNYVRILKVYLGLVDQFPVILKQQSWRWRHRQHPGKKIGKIFHITCHLRLFHEVIVMCIYIYMYIIYLDLARGAEWMIRGAYTPSLRVQTAPFGRCWYIYNPEVY